MRSYPFQLATPGGSPTTPRSQSPEPGHRKSNIQVSGNGPRWFVVEGAGAKKSNKIFWIAMFDATRLASSIVICREFAAWLGLVPRQNCANTKNVLSRPLIGCAAKRRQLRRDKHANSN